MEKSFEKHPAYEEEDLEIKTPEELKEAKEKAGTTTHEEAIERIVEKSESIKQKEVIIKQEEAKKQAFEFVKEIIEKMKERRPKGDLGQIIVYLSDGSDIYGRLIELTEDVLIIKKYNPGPFDFAHAFPHQYPDIAERLIEERKHQLQELTVRIPVENVKQIDWPRRM